MERTEGKKTAGSGAALVGLGIFLSRIAGLVRRQDAHAARVQVVRRGFAQILAEMKTSRIARATDERRLTDRMKRKVLMASLDTRRPAAQEQLRVLGTQTDVPTLPIVAGQQPVDQLFVGLG